MLRSALLVVLTREREDDGLDSHSLESSGEEGEVYEVGQWGGVYR